jgi:hypothetical protein
MTELLERLAAAPPPTPPALGPELEAELGKLAPVATRRPMRQLVLLLGASMIYGAALLALLTVRHDAGELPIAWLVGGGIAWLVGFVVPCYLALVPGAGSMLARQRYAAIAAIAVAIAFVVMGMMIHPDGPSSTQYGAARFIYGHWCLELGLATALVPVLLGTMFLRGALPVGSRWVAAALGAGGGSLGGLVLHFHCRITDPLHTGVIHAGVVTVAALLAAALVPRATDVR